MDKKSISDIVIESLKSIYSKAIFFVILMFFISLFLVWMILVKPGYNAFIDTKDKTKGALSDKNIQMVILYAEKNIVDINTLFRAAEGVIYAISSDISSFKGNTILNVDTLPLAKEFLPGGIIVD